MEELKEKEEAVIPKVIQMNPEPNTTLTTMDPEPVEEKQCGAGTILKDGYCQVISDNTESNEPVKEQNGFFEWLMSLFGL